MSRKRREPADPTRGSPIDHIGRGRRQARRFPLGAACARCGLAEPAALEWLGDEMLCHEHARAARGRSRNDLQHWIGRQLDPEGASRALGNYHRLVDDLKHDWPAVVRDNRTDDPLLLIAAMALTRRDRAQIDILYEQATANHAVLLAQALRERFGNDWPHVLNLPPFWEAPGAPLAPQDRNPRLDRADQVPGGPAPPDR